MLKRECCEPLSAGFCLTVCRLCAAPAGKSGLMPAASAAGQRPGPEGGREGGPVSGGLPRPRQRAGHSAAVHRRRRLTVGGPPLLDDAHAHRPPLCYRLRVDLFTIVLV